MHAKHHILCAQEPMNINFFIFRHLFNFLSYLIIEFICEKLLQVIIKSSILHFVSSF